VHKNEKGGQSFGVALNSNFLGGTQGVVVV
jgi:hypothetical protein